MRVSDDGQDTDDVLDGSGDSDKEAEQAWACILPN